MPETITGLAQSILDCVVDKLADSGLPVCEACIVAGATTPPADGCTCKCEGGQGRAWIRLVLIEYDGRSPSRSVGAEVSKCVAGLWNARFEVGVWRCIKDKDGKSCVPLVQDAAAMHRDLVALIKGVECCGALTEARLSWAPERAVPVGPEGLCAAATYQFVVQLKRLVEA